MQCKKCFANYLFESEMQEHAISCRIACILHNVTVPDMEIQFSRGSGIHMYIQLTKVDECARTGSLYNWKGRKWVISRYMTESEIVQTCFLAAKVAQEHELREFFSYRGEPVFRPHFDVNELWNLSRRDAIDAR